jgi:uncharacterized phage protein gp47/JayE
MAYGITPEGFVRKRLETIKLELEDAARGKWGQNVNLLPESVIGQWIGIQADRENEIWEMMEAVYYSKYPSTASGVHLDRVAEITAAIRKTPTPSTISLQLLFGDAGTIIPINSIVSVDGNPTAQFKTLAAVELIAGTDEQQKVGYSGDAASGSYDLVFDGESITILASDNAAAIQTKLDNAFGTGKISVSGSQTAATGLTFTFLGDTPTGYGKRDVALMTIENNAILTSSPAAIVLTVTETVAGVPQGSVTMQALTTGETVANAGTLTEIESPVTGWDSTVNVEDATVGQGDEEDPDFRLRRDDQVAEAGACTPDAIRADLLSINDVTAVVVFINKNDVEDADGRPPHSIDIVVQGGDEDELAAEIFATVGGGINTIGEIEKTVKDSQNFDQTVKFSRPTEVDIYVEIDLTVDAETFPVDGDDQVMEAILAYAEELGVGDDIIVHGSSPSLASSMIDVPGIVDMEIRVGTTVSPTTDSNVEMEPREIAAFDSSRITVTVL